MSLTIEKKAENQALQTMQIGGFEEGELSELKSMEHFEAKDKLLEMLDSRNGGIGTCWTCGYGVDGVWFDNEYAYINIGTSSD